MRVLSALLPSSLLSPSLLPRTMRRALSAATLATATLATAALVTACGTTAQTGAPDPAAPLPAEHGAIPLMDQTGAPTRITVTSTDFVNGEALPLRHAFNQFGCVGDNVMPALAWQGAPEGTQSYALIVHDPDAPTGVGFFHRVLINIPADVAALGPDTPAGARDLHTDYGQAGYGGPCPPPGPAHRYVFSVYALDVPALDLPASATGALTRFMLRSHALAAGHLVGTFAR